jgi:hypothetical protein
MFLPTLLLALSPLTAVELRCIDASSRTEVPPAVVVADSALAALYASGETWESFLAAARARRAVWLKNWASAAIPADALSQARTLPKGFRLLAIAVDACSDSVNTIPYLAKLVAEVPGLEMRIITPRAGRAIMAARPTPDGRPATPTVIVLDAEGSEVGCWIERPRALQALAMAAGAGGGTEAFAPTKQEWYDTDAGASTIREVVALLVHASTGTRGCDAAATSRGR